MTRRDHDHERTQVHMFRTFSCANSGFRFNIIATLLFIMTLNSIAGFCPFCARRWTGASHGRRLVQRRSKRAHQCVTLTCGCRNRRIIIKFYYSMSKKGSDFNFQLSGIDLQVFPQKEQVPQIWRTTRKQTPRCKIPTIPWSHLEMRSWIAWPMEVK